MAGLGSHLLADTADTGLPGGSPPGSWRPTCYRLSCGRRRLWATAKALLAAACVGVCLLLTALYCSLTPADGRPPEPGWLDVRVVKALGTRGYGQVRISLVSGSGIPPVLGFFDYSARFRYKWRQFFLHTTLKAITPGVPTTLETGVNLTVHVPPQGAGVAGVIIGDPCVNSPTGKSFMHCEFGDRFRTIERLPALINAFVGDRDTDFWGITGDNFYDRTGEITADFFSRISTEVKSKLFVTVPGNHDYWNWGFPEAANTADQCGNGYMQYYFQDTKAAEAAAPGSGALPFDPSVDPDANRPLGLIGCNLPAISNSFWYHQVGNVGLVGQSGAYPLSATRPYMAEACSWLAQQEGLEAALLVGHWDVPGSGAGPHMAVPEWYQEMMALPGCAELHSRGLLKFVMGHTHCNNPHPNSHGAGFRIAGFGMHGCGDFGVPVLDTTGRRVRLWYFDTSSDELYDALMNCLRSRGGWRACTGHAQLWLDQEISPPPARS
mmetsp:Transcript_23151/g.65625  ORF Transcript_23151/g.65625 Transcript_23151/m.65625 type:complete len:494 (-) Transcript_23151:130-1611(-)